MYRRVLPALGILAAVGVIFLGGLTASANAVAAAPVPGGGYYVPGAANRATMSFIVPSPSCAMGENSAVFTGLESAVLDAAGPSFASGVQSICSNGLPTTRAVQYLGTSEFPVSGVLPGDKVVITFNHIKGTITLKDMRTVLSASIDIPDASNQAGVFFGARPASAAVPLISGGKVRLSVTVDGGTLAAASPVRQTLRVGSIVLTPSAISTTTGKSFTVRTVLRPLA